MKTTRNSLLSFLLLLGVLGFSEKLQAQNQAPIPPDCIINVSNWTTAQSSASFPNYFAACQTWTFQYTSVGFTGLTITVQSAAAATSTTAGAFGTYGGTVVTGINPNTNTSGRVTTLANGLVDIPWIRVNLSGLTGSGTVFGVLYGYKTGYTKGSTSPASNCPQGTAGKIQAYVSAGVCGAAATVVSSLPSAAANTNAIFEVQDGASSTDCTVGSGTTRVLCASNGASWASLGGASPGGSNTQLQYNNSGVFGGASGSAWTDATRTLDFADSNGNNIFKFVANPAGESGGCGFLFYINCDGASPASVGTTPGTAGGGIEFDAPVGGITSIATTGTGGAGAPIILLAGIGGGAPAAAIAATGGEGGRATLQAASGANVSVSGSTNTSGAGGPASVYSGRGGSAAGVGGATNIAANAGDLTLVGAAGGSASGGASNTGGNAAKIYALINPGGTGSTANGTDGSFIVNAGSGDSLVTDVFSVSYTGIAKSTLLATYSNCADSTGAAACGAAPAGHFVMDVGNTTVVVSTTAVTANSEITIFPDRSLGALLGITCNAAVPPTVPQISARTAGTSFTLEVSAPVTNPACFGYTIVN